MRFLEYKTSKYSKAKMFGIWYTQYTILFRNLNYSNNLQNPDKSYPWLQRAA